MKKLQIGRRLLALAAAAALAAGALPVSALAEEGAAAETAAAGAATAESAAAESADDDAKADDIIILYTNDVHNAYERTEAGRLGYAAVAGCRDTLQAEGYQNITLVDGGDAIQGEAVGALTYGEAIVDLMNTAGYDVAVPGNHEFDFGMARFLQLSGVDETYTGITAAYQYVCCNFYDLTTGTTVLEPYDIIEYSNGIKVAYVGITTPESLTKSTPAYFQDGSGNYLYGFCQGEGKNGDGHELYEVVQASIDAAKAEGADFVVAVGHIGTDPSSKPWTSDDIIQNTSGLTAFLDAHSHSTIPGEYVADKDGKQVLRCSTGTKLVALGKMTLHKDGTAESELLDAAVLTADKDDAAVLAKEAEIDEEFDTLLKQVVAKSDVDLVTNDPATGTRLVRWQESNIGDFVADAYRVEMGADIGLINGGGVREAILVGDVTYGDIIAINPFGNMLCVVEATGQQILDALEFGARSTGAGTAGTDIVEEGSFLHVSGLTYDVDSTVTSGVELDSTGMMTGITGEYRVRNVMVGGEPLDLEKTYTVACHSYLLKNNGGGNTAFEGCTLLKDETMVDSEALIDYIADALGGTIGEEYADPYGQGRIRVIVASDESTVTYLRGSETVTADVQTAAEADGQSGVSLPVVGLLVCAVIAAAAIAWYLARRKKRG